MPDGECDFIGASSEAYTDALRAKIKDAMDERRQQAHPGAAAPVAPAK